MVVSACGGTRRADSSGAGGATSSSTGGGGESCTHPDWGLSECAASELDGFLFTVAELTEAATAQVDAVTTSCREIAVGLGAAKDAVTATDPAERVQAWCHVAAGEIEAEVTSKGKISVSAQPFSCAYGGEQAACEAACAGQPECATTDIAARCDPSMLSGTCSATCTGTCDGSGAAPIVCAGTCHGACSGTCDGVAMSEGACSGTCAGSCGGSCTNQVPAVKCDGACTGGCSVEPRSPVCREPLSSPAEACGGCKHCAELCFTEGIMKATCQPTGLGVTADPEIAPSTVELLRKHLPTLWNRRGLELHAAAGALEIVGKLIYIPGELPPSNAFAATCMEDGQEQAAAIERELFTSLEAAVDVTAAVSKGSP